MKKAISTILMLVCVIILISTLAGCNDNGEKVSVEKTAVCYVIANTANSKGLNFNSPLVQDTVYSTVRNYGFITVVSADGNPEVVHAASYDIEGKYKNASKEKLDMDARSKATNIIVSMQNIVANDPEVDYIESLRLALRSLSSLEGYDNKQIVVLGTGLSTTGVLDFNNNIISAEPSVVVELLKEKTEIPNFSGITIYWQQLGDVAAPQKELTSEQRSKLEKIYGGLVEVGGGTFIYNEIIANPVDSNTEYPTVTPVDLPSDTPISFDLTAFDESNEGDNALDEPVILTEEQVTFVGDKAEYLHPQEAKAIIQPIAEYLVKHPSLSVLLAGTTAGDEDSDYTLSLSLARADAVKDTLVSFGVEKDRIITVGLGSTNDPWHIWDAGYEGTVASSNRKVVLLDASSESAKYILSEKNNY